MGVIHHNLHVLTASARPLSVAEFINTVSRIWKPAADYDHNGTETFGLAVSGGVDSMALAALCSRMKSSYCSMLKRRDLKMQHTSLETINMIDLQAFVVDHGLRDGSAIEAQAVAKILEGKGINTRVLRIEWPFSDKPLEMSKFESLARKYRYQAIGRACRDHGINSLFLAHHQDDQAETVAMRLLTGRKRFGLLGMRPSANIPECYGMYGVHESGGRANRLSDSQYLEFDRGSMLQQQKEDQSSCSRGTSAPPLPETGGIRIYRPFLDFKKERLIATCQKEGIVWFEDDTNKDPSLTMRNAIRQMYRSSVMPTSLAKPALLKLSLKYKDRADLHLKAVQACLSQNSRVKLDTRSGVLNAHFKKMEEASTFPQIDSKLVAAYVLRSIIMLVSPHEHVELSRLYGALGRVFADSFPSKKLAPERTTFTVGGVQFQSSNKNKTLDSSKIKSWLVSRRPHTRNTSPLIIIPNSGSESWSEWSLYDGRYWIRIQNFSGSPICVRPLNEENYEHFRHSLSKSRRRELHKLLKEIAPGNIRFTLPSIVMQGNGGKEKVLALPSLNVSASESETLCKWEIKYKKLYATWISSSE